MTFIFNLGYPQPPSPQEHPRGGWGARGGIPPKIMCYVNSGVFNSGKYKNDVHFNSRAPQPLQGRP